MLDWVPENNYGVGSTLSLSGLTTTVYASDIRELVGSRLDSGGSTGVVDDTPQSITTLRVVGDIVFRWDRTVGSALLLWTSRLVVGIEDNLLGPAVFSEDLMDGSEANEQFLWQRSILLADGDYSPDVLGPNYAHIDVKVKRRLDVTQRLYMVHHFRALDAGGGAISGDFEWLTTL